MHSEWLSFQDFYLNVTKFNEILFFLSMDKGFKYESMNLFGIDSFVMQPIIYPKAFSLLSSRMVQSKHTGYLGSRQREYASHRSFRYMAYDYYLPILVFRLWKIHDWKTIEWSPCGSCFQSWCKGVSRCSSVHRAPTSYIQRLLSYQSLRFCIKFGMGDLWSLFLISCDSSFLCL